MPEDMTLKIVRASDSKNLMRETHQLSGDPNFLWDQIGLLLCDPLLVSFFLEREPTRDLATVPQT